MKTKDITPIEYANWKGCTPQYIHRLLVNGRVDKLPFVIRIKKYSRFYTLEVPETFNK